MKTRWLLPALVSVVLMLVAGCSKPPDEVPSLGTLEVDRITLVADSSEPLTEVDVSEGDAVSPGDVLARQDPARIQANLDRAMAGVAAAKARLDEAIAGPRKQTISAAVAQLAAAKSDVRTAKLELDRERELQKQHYAPQSNVDILQGRYDAATARQREAEAKLSELKAGTRSEELDAAQAALEIATADYDALKISLDRTSLIAPVKGKVEAVINEVGERPQPGSPVIVLVKAETPYARIHVPEPLRTKLVPGAKALVRIDGHNEPYKGHLRWIAHDASFTPFFALTQHDRSQLSYLAEVQLEGDALDKLPTGVPVQVFFPGVD